MLGRGIQGRPSSALLEHCVAGVPPVGVRKHRGVRPWVGELKAEAGKPPKQQNNTRIVSTSSGFREKPYMFSSNFNFCTLVFESWNTKFGRVVVHYTINRTNKDCRRYELPTVVVGTCKSKIEQTHVFLVHFVSCILLFLRCFVNFDPE